MILPRCNIRLGTIDLFSALLTQPPCLAEAQLRRSNSLTEAANDKGEEQAAEDRIAALSFGLLDAYGVDSCEVVEAQIKAATDDENRVAAPRGKPGERGAADGDCFRNRYAGRANPDNCRARRTVGPWRLSALDLQEAL